MSNILNIAVIFGLIIGTALFWHQLFRKSPEEGMLLSAVVVMISGFIFAYLEHLEYIYPFLLLLTVIGIVSFIFDLSFIPSVHNSILKRAVLFISPGVVVIMAALLYAVLFFKGAIYTYPDELYQWGPAVRYMKETSCLPYGSQFTGSDILFSMTSIFQYLWVGLVPFLERNTMIGNFLLAFIPIMLPFSGTGWKEAGKVFLYSAMLFLSWNILTYVNYYTLLQDYVLPMWAGGVIAWLIWKKDEKIDWSVLWGSMICIGAMKSMVSPLFCGIIIIVVVIRQSVSFFNKKTRRPSMIKGMIILGITVLSVILLTSIWSLLIQQNAYNRTILAVDINGKDVFQIGRDFFDKIFVISDPSNNSLSISYLIQGLLVIIFTVIFPVVLRCKEKKQLITITFSLYGVGFIGYLLVLLYAYVFVFSITESEIVAGLERYLSYYMLLGVIPLISSLFQEDQLVNHKKTNSVTIILAIVLIISTKGSSFTTKICTWQQVDSSIYKSRTELAEKCDSLKMNIDNDKRIFVFGELGATENKILTYELGNQYIWNEDCYKMYTRSSSDSEIYKDIIKYPSLLEENQYGYVWIYNIPEGCNYTRLNFLYHLPTISKGNFYRIESSGGKLTWELLDCIN